MKKILIALGLMVAFAVPAHADTDLDQYIVDLGTIGLTVTPAHRAEAWTLGLGVCVDLFNGTPVPTELAELAKIGMTPADASGLVSAAQRNLCPKTYGQAVTEQPTQPSVAGGVGGRIR